MELRGNVSETDSLYELQNKSADYATYAVLPSQHAVNDWKIETRCQLIYDSFPEKNAVVD